MKKQVKIIKRIARKYKIPSAKIKVSGKLYKRVRSKSIKD